MGLIDPRTIVVNVISSLAYFDEIVILNPFPNPVYMNREYSPTQSPAKHKSQMLKNVGVLLTLQPYIDAGIVHLVPDPMEFNADFRREMMTMIGKRTANWDLTKEEMRLGEALARGDSERAILRLPEDDLRRIVRETQPDISPELLERTIEHMKEKLAKDPLALLQPVQAGEDTCEFQVFRGMSLELALFVAHLTGSAIYSDAPSDWRQLHEQTSAAKCVGQRSHWAPLAKKLASLTFTIEANPLINLETRMAGKLARMRRVFRRIWNTVQTQGEDTDVDEVAKQLAARLENASVKAGIEWGTCSTTRGPSARLRRRIELSAPSAGFKMNSVHRLLITSGRTNYIETVPIALFLTSESVSDEVSAQ